MKAFSVMMLLTAAVFASVPLVDLTIQEQAGAARIEENITMGVPLPKSAQLADPTKFTLRSQGGEVLPCDFSVVCKWFDDTSAIRWLHLNFPYSINANTSETITLWSEDEAQTPASTLTATDVGTYIEVNTGKVRFRVKKANFNLLDEVWVDQSGNQDANKIVASHAKGLTTLIGTETFASYYDDLSTAIIEKQQSGLVVIKATGSMRNASASRRFNFISRIYAYGHSQMVKIVTTIENQNPVVTTFLTIKALETEIPLNLTGTLNAAVGRPSGAEETTVSGSEVAYIMVKRPVGVWSGSISGTLGGKVAGTFNPILTKPRDIGWVSLSDGAKGCVMGIRYFWQMVPTSAEVSGDGVLKAGFFPERANDTARIYAGMSRTLETRYVFFNTAAVTEQRSRIMGASERLFAVAPTKWYTRQTLGLGRFAENKTDLIIPTYSTGIETGESHLSTVWSTAFNYQDNHFNIDSYGFIAYGDNPHYSTTHTGFPATHPWLIEWNGNYYDLPQMGFIRFIRTGSMTHLRYAIAHVEQLQDIHQCHFGTGSSGTGSARYCPSMYYIFYPYEPIAPSSGEMDHHKLEGIFSNYYLTGEERSLDVALEGVRWAKGRGTNYANSAARSFSHQMFSLAAGYQHDQDTGCYNRLVSNWTVFQQTLSANMEQASPPQFQIGFAFEALVKMYYVLKSPVQDSVLSYLKRFCDQKNDNSNCIGASCIGSNAAIGYAFLSRFFGSAYLTKAQQLISLYPTSFSNHEKDMALNGRSLEQTMYYFVNPESLEVANEINHGIGLDTGGDRLVMSPNPFNPAVRLTLVLPRKGGPVTRSVSVAVYDIRGHQVDRFETDEVFLRKGVVWNAGERPGGVYMVRCLVDGKQFTGKATLIR